MPRMTWLVAVACLVSGVAHADDTMPLDFAAPDAAAAWSPANIVNPPAPGVKFVLDPISGRNCLQLTFGYGCDAGWSAVTTTKLALEGNWKQFNTLKLDLTVNKPLVAYVAVVQGEPNWKAENGPFWQHTIILQPGKNEMVLLLHEGIAPMDPAKGNISGVVFGAFRPEKGQTLLVDNVRLSADRPWTRDIGFFSPYNTAGYSAAAQRYFARGGTFPMFKVLGSDLVVKDYDDLSKKLADKWVAPAPKTAADAEAEFRAEFDKLKKAHPKAVLAVFREGDKGFDPADPDRVYSGWRMVYICCHTPDGPNPDRGEKTPVRLYETVEAFMRHRSTLMQADLSIIPKDSNVLAARLIVNRSGPPNAKTSESTPFHPNVWMCEACNRDWDPNFANCYFFAKGKLWKAVSGLYYGDDPDFRPLFIAHGPAGTGQANVFDFTEALKLWTGGTCPNHGFFFYGDSHDYMRIFTPNAKDVKLRPAIFVVYEPT